MQTEISQVWLEVSARVNVKSLVAQREWLWKRFAATGFGVHLQRSAYARMFIYKRHHNTTGCTTQTVNDGTQRALYCCSCCACFSAHKAKPYSLWLPYMRLLSPRIMRSMHMCLAGRQCGPIYAQAASVCRRKGTAAAPAAVVGASKSSLT